MDMGKRVAVISGSEIEAPVVPAGSPRAIGLGHDVERRRPCRLRRTDDAEIKHLLELILCSFKLGSHETSSAGKNRGTMCGHRVCNAMGRWGIRIVVGH